MIESLDGPEGVPESGPRVPGTGRIYSDLLGGKDTFRGDRGLADRLKAIAPDADLAARENREFLLRAVDFLAREEGITQFLDIGAGMPGAVNVSEVAAAANSLARVAYVDHDPVAVGRLKAFFPLQGLVTVALADLREPEGILARPGVRDLIDFRQPVAVAMAAVLHFLSDADAYPAVQVILGALASGSYLVLSHATADGVGAGEASRVTQAYKEASERLYLRPLERIQPFLGGLDVLNPGIVPVRDWRPDPGHSSPATRLVIYGAVARKAPPS
jgi:S-adenosyl methyltransferase